MPTVLESYSTLRCQRDTWTAAEFTAAIAPQHFSTLVDPEAELAAVRRKAHGAAVLLGLAWSPAGRYPMRVWTEVQR